MRFKIGIFGSTAENIPQELIERAWEIGLHIANKKGVLLTGACPGLSHQAACGAAEAGGLVIGISPASSLDEHIKEYKFPADEFYKLVFAGTGEKESNLIVLRSCNAVICISEKTEALVYNRNRLPSGVDIMFLSGSGEADEIPKIIHSAKKNNPRNRVFSIVNQQPYHLVGEIFKKLQTQKIES